MEKCSFRVNGWTHPKDDDLNMNMSLKFLRHVNLQLHINIVMPSVMEVLHYDIADSNTKEHPPQYFFETNRFLHAERKNIFKISVITYGFKENCN